MCCPLNGKSQVLESLELVKESPLSGISGNHGHLNHPEQTLAVRLHLVHPADPLVGLIHFVVIIRETDAWTLMLRCSSFHYMNQKGDKNT